MAGIEQILTIMALIMSSSAVLYVGSATAMVADWEGTSHTALTDVSPLGKPVRLQRGPDGLFHLRVTFDGIPSTAVLDTGASHSVIGKRTLNRLTRRNGHILAGSKRGGTMLTLSGKVDYRLLPIRDVSAEGFDLGALRAATIDNSGVSNVLGQDAISRFRSVTIQGDELILR